MNVVTRPRESAVVRSAHCFGSKKNLKGRKEESKKYLKQALGENQGG